MARSMPFSSAATGLRSLQGEEDQRTIQWIVFPTNKIEAVAEQVNDAGLDGGARETPR